MMNKSEQIAGQIDALAALRAEKAQVKSRLDASARRINQLGRQIITPIPATATGLFSMGSLLSNGFAIYQGIRMGSRMLRAVTSVFRRK